tara:strand:+ start:30 stop:434 length:405 start_codon:yes stop_codon:yes gene_type:complete
MGYPDPKDLKIWAGIIVDPEEDTNPQVPLFNWDDIDLHRPPKIRKEPDYFAQIEISMHADLANQVIALRKARQKFLDYSGCSAKDIHWIKITKENENVLFSSVKKVYTIEIQATKAAVLAYYRNKQNCKQTRIK